MATDGVMKLMSIAWSRYLIRMQRYHPPLCSRQILHEKLTSLAFGENGITKARKLAGDLTVKVQKACSLITRRCNSIAGHRTWRAFQIVSLYRQLYGEIRLIQTLRANLVRHRNLYAFLSSVGIFQWERDGISDEDIEV